MQTNMSREWGRRFRRWSAVGLLAGALLACEGDSGQLSRDDTEAIRALKAAYTRNAIAGDWDSWVATLTADAVVMPVDRKLRGRDAILVWARSMPRLSTFAAPIDEVRGAGNLAYATGSYLLTTTAADGTSSLEQGSFLDILRKQSDGSWRIARAIWRPHAPRPITGVAIPEPFQKST
jgi:ketosteroid isomerase-like protein